MLDDVHQKQTLLFSATMPREVMRISKNYMISPKTIEIASRNEGAKNVEHHYYLVNARDKYKALRRICDLNPNIYGIIFCRTRRETASIADKLMQDGYNADAIHGDLSQAQRDHVMARFRNKKLPLARRSWRRARKRAAGGMSCKGLCDVTCKIMLVLKLIS